MFQLKSKLMVIAVLVALPGLSFGQTVSVNVVALDGSSSIEYDPASGPLCFNVLLSNDTPLWGLQYDISVSPLESDNAKWQTTADPWTNGACFTQFEYVSAIGDADKDGSPDLTLTPLDQIQHPESYYKDHGQVDADENLLVASYCIEPVSEDAVHSGEHYKISVLRARTGFRAMYIEGGTGLEVPIVCGESGDCEEAGVLAVTIVGASDGGGGDGDGDDGDGDDGDGDDGDGDDGDGDDGDGDDGDGDDGDGDDGDGDGDDGDGDDGDGDDGDGDNGDGDDGDDDDGGDDGGDGDGGDGDGNDGDGDGGADDSDDSVITPIVPLCGFGLGGGFMFACMLGLGLIGQLRRRL